MDEAARLAAPERPLWVFARHQTAARGRSGKAWLHPAGNFAATWVAPMDRPPAERALTSFVAAVALKDTLGTFVRRDRLAMKWPNDVLLDGGKVAGILLESAPDRLAVGIGINLAAAPDAHDLPEGAVPPVSLAAAGIEREAPVTPEEVLTQLATDFDRWLKLWEIAGFDAIRQPWLRDAASLGRQIRVRLPKEELHGVFETVDPDGCLVLQMPGGTRRISAGEVFLQ